MSAAMRLAMKRVDLLGPVDQLRALGTALLKRAPTFSPLVDLRAMVVTPGGAVPDR